MKVGDKYDVTIAGQVIAQAEVRELADGQVTLIVPGTKVVMATRTDIAPEPINVSSEGAGTIIEGVERESVGGRESAPVGETANSSADATEVANAQPPVTQVQAVGESPNENAQSVVETTTPPSTTEAVETQSQGEAKPAPSVETPGEVVSSEVDNGQNQSE